MLQVQKIWVWFRCVLNLKKSIQLTIWPVVELIQKLGNPSNFIQESSESDYPNSGWYNSSGNPTWLFGRFLSDGMCETCK